MHSQVPASSPNPQPDRSSPCLHNPLPHNPFYIILQSIPGSYKWSLNLRFALRSSLEVSDQVRHSYETTSEVIFLYIVIFILFIAKG